jgi:hypothetical protein
MRAIVVATLFATFGNLAALPTPRSATQTDDRAADDRNVLAAVVDDTIRPEVRRLTGVVGSGVASLMVIDHTVTLCGGSQSPRSLCMHPDAAVGLFQNLAVGNMRAGVNPVEAVPSTAVREELSLSMTARNSESHPFPAPEIADVTLVGAPPPLTVVAQSGRWTGYTVFSLPGYSSDGHAVVYAFYDCSGRCGTAWLFLLEKRGADWLVQYRHVAAIF